MRQFITQHRVLLLVLLLVLIGLHLLSSGFKHKTQLNFFGKAVLTIYTPIYKILSWPFAKIALGLSKYIYLVDLKESNDRLRLQNRELKGQLSELEELRSENERLQNLYKLKESNLSPIAYARVIGRSMNREFRTLLLDVGTSDGIERGMAVIAPDGLVGFVAACVPNAAKVVLITDASARIDAILQRTRSRTMVYGRGQDHCTLEYLDTTLDVAVGDRVVTSGLGGIFPKGIAIGHVATVERGESGMLQGIVIEPAVDLNAIEEVAVAAGGHGGAGLEN